MKKRSSKRFEYSVQDLDCVYCLHYQGKNKPCPLEICCCEEEKQEVSKRMQTQGEPARRLPHAMTEQND